MKKNLKTAVFLLVVALLALPMYAQPGRGQRPDGQRSGMGQRPGMGQGMQFSEEDMKDRISSLADTLKLSDSQEKQILDVELKFVRTMQSQRQNFNFETADREAFRANMLKLRDERDAKYKEVLNGEQYAKYNKMVEGRRSQMRQRPPGEGGEQERPSRGRGRGGI